MPNAASKPITMPAIAPPLSPLFDDKGCGSCVVVKVTVVAGELACDVLDAVVGAEVERAAKSGFVQLLHIGLTPL